MKGKTIFLFGLCMLLLAGVGRAMAIEDPLLHENNRIGVHLLSPDEVSEASKLVNGEKGEWGYVVVPIQATDRDREKWTRFMEVSAEKKVIPIVRVATLVDGVNWEEPNNYDLVHFANFLNALPWPTKNRYVVIFNEVNRGDEYGGFVSADHYARILNNAITIFKQRSDDFFMLPAGLDNSYRQGNATYWNNYVAAMEAAVPGIFERVDGWTSHAYPNPGFIGRVSDRTERSIASWMFDLSYLQRYTKKNLSVFITETGWDNQRLGEEVVARNFSEALAGVWSDPRIVTVAPFVLRADNGPFEKLSLLKQGSPTAAYKAIAQKTSKGEPSLATPRVNQVVAEGFNSFAAPAKELVNEERWKGLQQLWQELLRLVFGVEKVKKGTESIMVGGQSLAVEIADTEILRERGLSGREGLENNKGMLFTFEESGARTFWMKEMKFDIKIVWIRGGRVVGVSQGYYQNPYQLIPSPGVVEMVLEVNNENTIKVGDEVEIQN